MIDLPHLPDVELFTVLMTVLLALGASSFIAGWAERRFSLIGFGVTAIALGGFVWVGQQEGFGLDTIPYAFIEITARLIR